MAQGLKHYLSSGISMLGITLVIQVLTLVRTVQLASAHGAGHTLDAFYFAFTITVAVFNIVAPAVTTIIIPSLVRGARLADLKNYSRATSGAVVMVSVVLMVVFWFGRSVLFPGGGAQFQQLAVLLCGILIIGQQIRVATAIRSGALQAEERFIISRVLAIIPALAPVAALFATSDIVFISAVIASSYLFEYVAIRLVSKGLSKRVGAGSEVGLSRELARDTLPVIVSSALFQVQMVIVIIVVSRFEEGAVAIYGNATQLSSMVQVVILQNVVLLAYPKMSQWLQLGTISGVRRVGQLISVVSFVPVFALIVYFSFGEIAIVSALARGSFSEGSAVSVFVFGLWLLLTLPASTVRDLMYRVLYVKGRAKLASGNSIVVVVVTLLALFPLVSLFDIYGVFICLFAASVISALSSVVLVRNVVGIQLRRWFPMDVPCIILVGLVFGVSSWIVGDYFQFASDVVIGSVTVFAFCIACMPFLIRGFRGLRQAI